MRTKIIAEIGVNHNGNFNTAMQLIDGAKKSGADIVKFQYFKADELVTKGASSATYQENNTGIKFQSELLKELEISFSSLSKLKDYCDSISIEFLCTSFSIKGLKQLCNLGMKKIKIPSGEINNKSLLLEAAKLKKEIYLSTGMSNLAEVKQAINILAGYEVSDITLMHCTSLYPAPYSSLNINALRVLKNNFKHNLGYSDHSIGSMASIIAVSLGANVLEKHITLNKKSEGPDHRASMEIKEFTQYIKDIRNAEKILGNESKSPDKREIKVKKLVRKSWYATKSIKKGEKLNKNNVVLKRPEGGISPLIEIYGKVVNNDISAEDPIKKGDII